MFNAKDATTNVQTYLHRAKEIAKTAAANFCDTIGKEIEAASAKGHTLYGALLPSGTSEITRLYIVDMLKEAGYTVTAGTSFNHLLIKWAAK